MPRKSPPPSETADPTAQVAPAGHSRTPKKGRKRAPAKARAPAKRKTRQRPPVWPKAFLTALGLTGNVLEACRAAGVGRSTVYDRREANEAFAKAWEAALQEAADVLETEARRRAVYGVNEPVFYKGEEVGVVRRYSDVLLIFLLKGARPEKYRERFEHTGKDGGAIEFNARAILSVRLDQIAAAEAEGKPSKPERG